MLEESFIFLQGIKNTSEKNIWQQGINNWEEYLNSEVKGFSKKKKSFHRQQIEAIKKAIFEENIEFLAKKFPKREMWRLYDLLKDDIIFLDIETTGRYDITVIGLYDGEEQTFLVKGRNLSKENLEKYLTRAKAIVTFNGRSFDIPVIEKYFGIKIEKVHIDLMHVLGFLGYKGGLKTIEKELGIRRPEEVETADGSDAVLLWNSYMITEDEEYLMKLLLYNEQDCINLKTLIEYSIPRLWRKTRNYYAHSTQLPTDLHLLQQI